MRTPRHVGISDRSIRLNYESVKLIIAIECNNTYGMENFHNSPSKDNRTKSVINSIKCASSI